jgi:ribosome-binding protein aMBF1 (putative translation factor)
MIVNHRPMERKGLTSKPGGGRRPSGFRRLHDQTKVPVGDRVALIAAREALGLNRPQLAAKMARSRSFVYRVETGVIDPGLASIAVWLKALGPEATIHLFEPHPRMRLWSELVAADIHKVLSQENYAA